MGEGKHTRTPQVGGASSSIEEQADQLLHDIEATSSFSLPNKRSDSEGKHSAHARGSAGPLEPDDIVPDGIASTDERIDAGLTPAVAGIDELTDDIDLTPQQEAPHDEAAEQAERAEAVERKRRHLRTALAVFIVILVLAAVAIGMLIWGGMLTGEIGATDTEDLSKPSAGTGDVAFQAIDDDVLPDIVGAYGMTLDEVTDAYGEQLVFDEDTSAESDERVEALVSLATATMLDADGKDVGDVGFGLDASGTVVYVYCLLDLDALAVADASYSELVASAVVAKSVLVALGVDDDVLDESQLTEDVSDSADEGDEDADSSKSTAQFSGQTGLTSPATWELAETYDYTTGIALGDNSVIRTLLVEFY